MEKTAREDLPRPQKKKVCRIVLWTLLGLVLAGLGLGGWHAYRILKQPASLFSEAPAATTVPQATILAPAFPVHTDVPTPEPEGAEPAAQAQTRQYQTKQGPQHDPARFLLLRTGKIFSSRFFHIFTFRQMCRLVEFFSMAAVYHSPGEKTTDFILLLHS